MATISISISAAKNDEADESQEAGEIQAAQELVQRLKDDGYSTTASFSGAAGTTQLTGTAAAADTAST